ncbi:signal transduction histidine kinase [Chloropicon primus]|uniref:histidine kinase n=3 Tax=Eukaryota TaxID=2759 RepID=A0A5B8MF20_9CHLO|nr:putative LOV domain-containing protein [uncultured eukaryote]QDZ17942.1 signal transduction histidine kinase [Chloropicon primus]UPQ97157.1 signal transduction histidine kinase [Chloropicon primus]|eukprot:QDZ17942.1 signal transduction histidine kinase [Chloropicon primus]
MSRSASTLKDDEAGTRALSPPRKKRPREECSESLGSVDRIKGRTRYSASPAPETSSGNTVQNVDYLQREVSRLNKALKAERESSKRLRIELDRMLSNRRESCSKEMPSLSTLEDLWLKEKSMNVLKEGITIVDCNQTDFPIIYANEGFVRMTGYSESETLGRNCRFLQGPNTEQSAIATLRQAVSERKSCAVKLTNYRKNGEMFINYLSLTPIFDNDGMLQHYVGIQSDITELIQRQKAEIEAKDAADKALSANEAKSQFLARMSHEIRTPLNGMIAVGQLLAETRLTHQQRDLVNTIRCSGETLLALITDILDFSKIEANKLSLYIHDFSLQSIIEDTIEIAGLKAAQKKLHVAYSLSPHVPETLRGDSTRIKQVLLNVLYNAVKFTESGIISLEASVQVCDTKMIDQPGVENNEVIPSYSKSDISDNDILYLIHFSVKDTGVGMTAEGLSRLFVSFTQLEEMSTRRYGGTGLGLAISKKLCEAMGGEMWAESKGLGKGSIFHCTLKCHSRQQKSETVVKTPIVDVMPDTQSTDKSYHNGLDGKACIIVEENDAVRESLSKAMRAWGLKVTPFASEQSALAYLVWPSGPSTAGRSINKNNILLDFVIIDKDCKHLMKALVEQKRDISIVFIVWPAADEINGIGDTSKNLRSPLENDLGSFPHLCVQRPVRHGRLKNALEELCSTKRFLAMDKPLTKMLEAKKESGGPRCVPDSKCRIMIAEDNVINMKVCLGILRRLGFMDITTAEDGVIALREIHSRGGPSAFDVIFMDLHMPRKGGMEVVKELKETYGEVSSCKIVAVTADAFAETKEKCFVQGFSHWIAKPFRIKDIEKVFESHSSDNS